MKSIKNAMKIFILSSFLLGAFFSKAQNNESVEKRKEVAEQRFKELSERLQLTTDQQTKLKAIAKDNRMEMKQLREAKKDATKEERKVAVIVQLKKVNDQINAILSPKQKELFKQYKAEKKVERENKMKEKSHENGGMDDEKLF